MNLFAVYRYPILAGIILAIFIYLTCLGYKGAYDEKLHMGVWLGFGTAFSAILFMISLIQ